MVTLRAILPQEEELMSAPFGRPKPPFGFDALVKHFHSVLDALPDRRTGHNTVYYFPCSRRFSRACTRAAICRGFVRSMMICCWR